MLALPRPHLHEAALERLEPSDKFSIVVQVLLGLGVHDCSKGSCLLHRSTYYLLLVYWLRNDRLYNCLWLCWQPCQLCLYRLLLLLYWLHFLYWLLCLRLLTYLHRLTRLLITLNSSCGTRLRCISFFPVSLRAVQFFLENLCLIFDPLYFFSLSPQ
jgi:hypothetical protein